jgi:hypothetical protein
MKSPPPPSCVPWAPSMPKPLASTVRPIFGEASPGFGVGKLAGFSGLKVVAGSASMGSKGRICVPEETWSLIEMIPEGSTRKCITGTVGRPANPVADRRKSSVQRV